jgi:hemerythrin superfamily protein
MTDIFTSLEADHRGVERLFQQYAESPDDAIARDICDALTQHGEIEAQVLYPEIRRIVDGGDDLADDAEAQHAAIATVIAQILYAPLPDLGPLIADLNDLVVPHVASEEDELFPLLREAGGDAEALGQRLDAARVEAQSRASRQVG